MAKARKAVPRSKKARRTTTKRRTKAQVRSQGGKKKAVRKRQPRKKNKGIIAKVTNAVQTVADTFQETKEIGRRMGPRGGLSEG